MQAGDKIRVIKENTKVRKERQSRNGLPKALAHLKVETSEAGGLLSLKMAARMLYKKL